MVLLERLSTADTEFRNWNVVLAKVSIVITCYNYARFLGTAVKSCLNQKEFDDFEVLIIDDGSEDGSVQVGERLAELSSGRVSFFQIEHGGRSKARNYGIQKAESEYLVFLDADDFLHKSFLLEMVWALELMPECPFAYSYYYLYRPPYRMLVASPSFNGDRFYFANGIPVTALVRRNVAERAGGFEEKLDLFEDCDFWLRTIQFGMPHLVPMGLWFYRRHKGNSTYFNEQNLRKTIALRKIVKENWESRYENIDFTKIENEMNDLHLVCEDCIVRGCSLYKNGWIKCCLDCSKRDMCEKYQVQSCLVFNRGEKLDNDRS